MDADEINQLAEVFRDSLVACLEECAKGRQGLFTEVNNNTWTEALNVRCLADGIQVAIPEDNKAYALCGEFMELSTINITCKEEERGLAKAFLERIAKGQVGSPMQEQVNWKGMNAVRSSSKDDSWDQSPSIEESWDQSVAD